MGLFDKVKSNIDTAVEKTKEGVTTLNEKHKEYNEMQKEKYRRQKEEKIEKIRTQFNIYDGIECKVMFPQEELRLKSHGGFTKGVATLGFGLVGLAATSGVKQEKKRVVKNTELQLAEKGVVFKKVTDDGKDLRIPYEEIISFTTHKQQMRNNKEIVVKAHYELLLLENQSLIIALPLKGDNLEIISQDLVDAINANATGKDNEETGWGLDHATNEALPEPEVEQISSGEVSVADELDKVMQMYEKGLLTDDEFTAMKKKIIEK